MHEKVDSRFTYSFFTVGRARVVDLVPGKRGAPTHQPPILLFPPLYVYDLCLDSTGTGPIARTSLQYVSPLHAGEEKVLAHRIVEISVLRFAI